MKLERAGETRVGQQEKHASDATLKFEKLVSLEGRVKETASVHRIQCTVLNYGSIVTCNSKPTWSVSACVKVRAQIGEKDLFYPFVHYGV